MISLEILSTSQERFWIASLLTSLPSNCDVGFDVLAELQHVQRDLSQLTLTFLSLAVSAHAFCCFRVSWILSEGTAGWAE